MKKSLFYLLFSLIILLAVLLRFVSIANNPPSLTWDEAAWGYNAYSIGLDGKDEFGRFLPFDYLESFGDFKPPVYAYLSVIPVKIFGLNEFSTRFASAFFGVLTVIVTFFLTERIFRKSKNVIFYGLIASFMLAISPWHILLSRAAFEANVATCFLVVGIWAFLAGVQDKKNFLIISAISFAISLYTFNTSRVFAPLIVLFLAIAYRNRLLKMKKEVLTAGVVGFLIVLPIIGFLLSPEAALRFREVNIFSDPGPVKTSNQNIENNHDALWAKIIDNRRVYYAESFMSHYLDNLAPLFLFIKGDGNPKFSIQTVGQMYIWEVVFFVAGLLFLFRRKEGEWWLIPVWLLLGIIPAATARETPHALRIETTLPTFQIIVAYGIVVIFEMLSKLKYKLFKINLATIVFVAFSLFAIFNFVYFIHDYFYQYPAKYSSEWQYGYRESIDYVKSVQDKYDYIQITTALGRPYIYYLYYTKTLPSDFRKTANVHRDAFGFVTVESFGKYKFPDNFTYASGKNKKVLYVNTPFNLPSNKTILKTFYTLDGKAALVAYTLN